MAAAHTKQLQDQLARYERIVSECRRCKAALALEEVEDVTPPPVPSPAAGSFQQTALNVSSTASDLSSKNPKPTGRQGPSTRSSQQTASDVSSTASDLSSKNPKPTGRQGPPTGSSKPTSQSMPSPSSTDVVDPEPSIAASASAFGKAGTGPSRETVRQSSRLSKQTIADAVTPLPGRSSTPQTFTAHSFYLRPTSLKPSSSGIDTLSAETNRPDTAGPNISRSRPGSNAQTPQNEPQKQAGWVVSADKMLGEVPLGWVWHEKLLQMDKSMLAAVAMETTAVPDDIIGVVDNTQHKDHLLRLVRSFAHRHSDKRVNFQHFLLMCLCKVLSAQGVPQKSIVEALQICIGDTSERNVGKYLKGAKWANELMDRLFFTSWGYRAVDLLVIWDRSVAMFGKVASSLYPTNDYFVSHLSQADYCKDVEEIPNRVHTTIPWIVKKEFGDGVSYETICKALGYRNEYILETKHLHSSTQSSAMADSSSSEGEDSASETLSFHTARHSANGAFIHERLGPAVIGPSGDLDGAAYLRAWSLMGRQLLPKDNNEESARRDPATDQIADLQRTERSLPDRSTKPFGLSDIVPPRKPPSVDPNTGELLVSTSLGESAPSTRNTKRPLPDSPTSQSQPENGARRRQHEGEMFGRERMASSSRSGKKDSHRQRTRG